MWGNERERVLFSRLPATSTSSALLRYDVTSLQLLGLFPAEGAPSRRLQAVKMVDVQRAGAAESAILLRGWETMPCDRDAM